MRADKIGITVIVMQAIEFVATLRTTPTLRAARLRIAGRVDALSWWNRRPRTELATR